MSGRLSIAERSRRVAELSRGTVHVDGSEVIVDNESTMSFEVSFIGPQDFGEVSVGILLFPFEFFLLPFVIPAEEPDINLISGEIERELELECKPRAWHMEKNKTSRFKLMA